MTSQPILSVNNISIHFGGICALNGISFEVQDQSVTSIIGPNGAGKTTLFNCITGFYRSDHGSIILNRKDGSVDIKQQLGADFSWKDLIYINQGLQKIFYHTMGGSHLLAKFGIARTFQNLRLFGQMTVLENMLIAQHLHLNRSLISGILNTVAFQKAQNNALERARYLLSIFDLEDKLNRLANQLSYGQQRQLEIARALATEPCLICLDEPAAGLNGKEVEALQNRIEAIVDKEKIGVLLIEHHMSLVMGLSSYIVVLNAGKKIAEGAPDKIQNDPEVIAAYLGEPTK